MRLLFSAFMIFIVIFLTAVFFLSGMGERFFISTAHKTEGESILRKATVIQFKSTAAPHYIINLEGISGAPSLDLHLTTGNRLYDLKLMYDNLSKLDAGSRIKIEWCSTFISGIIITGINGVSVISPVDKAAFIIWIFMTIIGFIMFVFVATIMVYSFRK